MKKLFFLAVNFIILFTALAQETIEKKPLDIPELKIKFDDNDHYLKFNITAQIWNRFNQSNPGTVINNEARKSSYDIGIRRLRFWAIAKPFDWLLVATQFGLNNFNNQSSRKAGDFFHDAYIEVSPFKNTFSFGTGLCAWNSNARYSAPSIGSILPLDAPLYQQSTNDVVDQFDRALSVYAKGQIQKIDYRLAVSTPLSLVNTPFDKLPIQNDAIYNSGNTKPIVSAYVKYQFFDEESNAMPYGVGSYLGSKKIVAVGAGVEHETAATIYLNSQGDTIVHQSLFVSGDVFLDMPVNKKADDNLTFYAAYTFSDLGPNYLRNVGAMNPASGTNVNSSFNGKGNAYPIIGTGHTLYTQLGYMLPKHLIKSTNLDLQFYADMQASDFNKLSDWMLCYNTGLNMLLVKNKVKLSFNYQNRPVFDANNFKQISRKSGFIMQWQVSI